MPVQIKQRQPKDQYLFQPFNNSRYNERQLSHQHLFRFSGP